MSDENVVVYGLADGSEPAGKGFEPYEEAAVSLRPEWVVLEGDSINVDQLPVEAEKSEGYVVTPAENYEAFSNDELMPIAVRYREHDTPVGSPGTVLTYPGSDISDIQDLSETTIAVEEKGRGTTMGFLTAAQKMGYDAEAFDFLEVSEEESPRMLENKEIDAAILDSEDWLEGSYDDVFNFNRVLADTYGQVPPAQVWVADRDSYMEDPDVFRQFVHWGKNVRQRVEEMTAERTDLTAEEERKIDVHTRFDEFTPQDSEAIEDITEVADQVL